MDGCKNSVKDCLHQEKYTNYKNVSAVQSYPSGGATSCYQLLVCQFTENKIKQNNEMMTFLSLYLFYQSTFQKKLKNTDNKQQCDQVFGTKKWPKLMTRPKKIYIKALFKPKQMMSKAI